MLRVPRYAWFLGIAAAAGLALFAALRATTSSDQPTYETSPVTRGPLIARVTASGTLQPSVTVQVGSQVSGRLLEVLADFNSPVTKGQVIARIDPRLLEAELARAEANLRAAAASVERASAEFEVARQTHARTKALAERELVSQADIDEDVAAYRSAQSQVVSARAALGQTQSAVEQAKVQLAYTTIVSPIDGVVISRDVQVGQTVAASLQAPQLFSIAGDLKQMVVHTHVAEADVGQLKPGIAAEFTVDAYPTQRFRGTVKEVRYSPQNVQNVVTYDAVVSVPNEELRLRPGMTANVSFLLEEREDALQVPNTALRFRPADYEFQVAGSNAEAQGQGGTPQAQASVEGGRLAARRQARQERQAGQGGGTNLGARRVVWILGPDEKPKPLEVRIGITDGRSTELLAGDLKEGDFVLVAIVGEEPSQPRSPFPSRGGPGGGRGGGGNRRGGFGGGFGGFR